MPRIPDYTALGQAPEPRATRGIYETGAAGVGLTRAAAIVSADAEKAGSGMTELGRGTGRLGLALAEAEERARRQQAALDMAAAKSALVQNSIDITQKLNDDPNYEGWAENYKKQMEENKAKIIGRIRDPYTAQMFGFTADELIARGEGHVGTEARTRAHQAIAEHAADLSEATIKKALETTNEGDRTELFNAFNEYVTAAVKKGAITGVQGVALKRRTAESYAEGWVQTRPLDELLKILPPTKEGAFPKTGTPIDLISPEKRLTMLRSAEVEVERIKRLLDEQKRDAQMKIADAFLVRLQSGAENPLTPKDILSSTLDPNAKKQFLDMLERSTRPEPIRTDPATYIELFDRIHLPEGHPNKLVEENDLNKFLIAGKLSHESLVTLRSELQGKRTAAGEIEGTLKKGLVEIAKTELTGTNQLLGIRDPIGDTQLQKFMALFLAEYERLRKTGKTAFELLSPDSPDYLGKHVASFRRTPEQQLLDLIRGPSLVPPGPQPPVAR